MPRQVFVFDPPDRFVAGTVGQPGDRTFFLQARTGTQVVSVALEKAQVAVLAERVGALMEEVRRVTDAEDAIPGPDAVVVDDLAPLDLPVDEEFRVGTMALAWDTEAAVVVIEAQGQPSDPEVEPPEVEPLEPLDPAVDGPATLRVRLSAAAALSFAARAGRVVSAGRPPCPLCALPLEATGHICPRQNGHRR